MKQRPQKRAWTSAQDEVLINIVSERGSHSWEIISQELPGRTGKQCRERWNNQLNPLLKKNQWELEEILVLFILQQSRENRWSEISMIILGRSDNSIKNHWNSVLKDK